MVNHATYHSTECELEYLSKIGGWKEGIDLPKAVRIHYLERYLEGALQRKEWGMVDGGKVIDYVRQELERLTGL
jgi:hypothetical protein